MKRVTASFARSLKESHIVPEKKYEVKKVVNNGVSDVIKSDVLKTGSMGIDVVKGEDVVISDTLKDEGVCDAVTSDLVKTGSIETNHSDDVVKGEAIVMHTVSDGVGERLDRSCYLRTHMDAALGNSTGGALLWRILEDFAILTGSSTVLIAAYIAGRWVIEKYKHRNIRKYVLRFKGLNYQLPNGYALAHATHYAKLEVVVVHVKFEGIKQIDVGVDVVSEEIAKMIVDKKELEEVKGVE
ncbi:hypothetical protein Tco_0574215 [Tanacetum coccineum]